MSSKPFFDNGISDVPWTLPCSLKRVVPCLTNVIEIMQGDIKKSIMIGDSETDAESAKAAQIPFILVEDGYTEKKVSDIHHNYLIKNFVGIDEIINKYLID